MWVQKLPRSSSLSWTVACSKRRHTVDEKHGHSKRHFTTNQAGASGELPAEGDDSEDVVAKCLCGDVLLKLPAGTMPGQMSVCHCSMCRQASGAPYVPFVALPRRFISGVEVATYAASTVAIRGFCRKCGSFMYMDYGEPTTIWWTLGSFRRVPAGWLQSKYAADTQNCQIFQESAADWRHYISKLPHFDYWGTLRVDACDPASKAMWMEHEALLNQAGSSSVHSGSKKDE